MRNVGPFIGVGCRVRRVAAEPMAPVLAPLTLSTDSLAEGAAPGSFIGTLQNRTPGSTLTLFDNAGGRIALSGANLIAGLVATDFEAAATHEVVVRETLAGAVNSPRDTVLVIGVVNVDERPQPVFAPIISGSPAVGQTLAATTGNWTGQAPIVHAYQWRRDGAAIAGAMSSVHVLTPPDIGAMLTCLVTASNADGATSALSNALGPVTSAADPATPLTNTRSISLGARNGDGFQNSLVGPQLTQLFGSGTVGAAGALAIRVRVQPGGLNSNASAATQTIQVPVMGTGSPSVGRGFHCAFGAFAASSNPGIAGRFAFAGRDQASANYLGDRDANGASGATGTTRWLRTPPIVPNAQGSWTGLVVLRRDGAGQFQALTVGIDGTVNLGDSFTPATWLGSSLTSGAMTLGSFPAAATTFGNWFPGEVCDFIQLAGSGGTDAEWQSIGLGADPATVFGANLAAYFRFGQIDDLAQTAGARSYAAFTLSQSDAASRPIANGPQLRPRRNGTVGLLARPQYPGYVHALPPASVRAAASRAAVAALTGTVVRDVVIIGAATHVQGRALRASDGTQLVGWTRVTASAASGIVEVSLPGVPVGEHIYEFRREDDNTVISVSVDRERVGIVASLIGQSQTQIAFRDSTTVSLTPPTQNTSVSYLFMRGGGQVWNPPDGGLLTRRNQLSEGFTAVAQMLDALGPEIPIEFLCVAQQGTGISQLIYRYTGDGLDLCGDGTTPSSGMLTANMLAKRKRVTCWLYSWATNDASSRNGGSPAVGTTFYGTRSPVELSWNDRMNEFFGGIAKAGAGAPELAERQNLHKLGFASAWNPWVVVLPVSRHRSNQAGAAPADTAYGPFRTQQYDMAVNGTGKAGNWDISLGAFQIDTYMPDGESAHQDRTDARGNIRFCLRYAQALAFAGKLSTQDNRPGFTSIARAAGVLTLSTTLRNGGSLVSETAGATPEEFEVSEDGGTTWSRRDGAIPFTPAISGSAVTLTRGTGSWAANTRVRYLNGWPVAVGGTAGMAATELTRLGGLLYETRADAIPAGLAGSLRAGVPLMPLWADMVAA